MRKAYYFVAGSPIEYLAYLILHYSSVSKYTEGGVGYFTLDSKGRRVIETIEMPTKIVESRREVIGDISKAISWLALSLTNIFDVQAYKKLEQKKAEDLIGKLCVSLILCHEKPYPFHTNSSFSGSWDHKIYSDKISCCPDMKDEEAIKRLKKELYIYLSKKLPLFCLPKKAQIVILGLHKLRPSLFSRLPRDIAVKIARELKTCSEHSFKKPG